MKRGVCQPDRPQRLRKIHAIAYAGGLFDRPDSGQVLVSGVPIDAPSLSRGIVFQDHRLLPWLSVEDNILLSLKRQGGATEKTARASPG